MKNLERRINIAYCVAAASLAFSLYAVFAGRSVPTASAQTDMYLSRRIDQVEQRFYSLESRLNRVESTTRPAISTPLPGSTNDAELQFMRTAVDALRTRVGELECGVLRIDERTLTPAARTQRRQRVRNSEPCRQDANSPISLSVRP